MSIVDAWGPDTFSPSRRPYVPGLWPAIRDRYRVNTRAGKSLGQLGSPYSPLRY